MLYAASSNILSPKGRALSNARSKEAAAARQGSRPASRGSKASAADVVAARVIGPTPLARDRSSASGGGSNCDRGVCQHPRTAVSDAGAGTSSGASGLPHLAYKDVDAVIAAQADLIEVAHTLRQGVCVKG
jgi:tRNA-splicing ligase RtcB